MTITGNPASFKIMGAASKVNSLTIPFSPIQNLNGYDHPWIGTDYDQQPYNFMAVSSSSISPLGNSEMGNIVGGTVAWNQLMRTRQSSASKTENGVTITDNRDGTYTVSTTASGASANTYVALSNQYVNVVKDHKYLLYGTPSTGSASTYYSYIAGTVTIFDYGEGVVFNATASGAVTPVIAYVKQGAIITTPVTFKPQCFDLTQMFGSAIADYIYSLETATAGTGVTYFRKLFPKDYYAYNAGELLSVNTSQHKMVGFNAFNPETGTARLVGGMQYQITGAYTALSLDGTTITPDANGYFTPSADGTLTVTGGNSTTTCVHLVWDGERDGEYEPYVEHAYPLDSSLELRGIPKLDASNNLYYDGDSYAPDGTVERRYGIVDLGTLRWQKTSGKNNLFNTRVSLSTAAFGGDTTTVCKAICNKYLADNISNTYSNETNKTVSFTSTGHCYIEDSAYSDKETFEAAMSGVYLVYKLTTPTTESATAYAATQSIDPDGTEEYVDYAESQGTRDVAIPVGHYTNYANICPISGRTGLSVYVSPTTAQADATTYAVDWTSEAGTVYGGSHEVVGGVLTDEWAEIPSYNGETITEPWLSSMDAYTPGATPTMGAQVVYKLATPLTYQLTPQEVELLVGQNYVWSDTNEAITIDFDVLSFIRQKFKVNNVDFSAFVERDGYKTSLAPVYGETIQTLDGVGHTAMLRLKGELSLKLNPRTAEDTASLCTELLKAPCEVQYHCLQRNMDVTALMTIDSITAAFLSRCLYWGQRWNQTEDITLTEL